MNGFLRQTWEYLAVILIVDVHEAFHVDEREAIRKNSVVLVGKVEVGVNEELPGIGRGRIVE